MKTNPDETAFPLTSEPLTGCDGLTKREYFAALALQGLLANPDETTVGSGEESLATIAVGSADALIAKLNGK